MRNAPGLAPIVFLSLGFVAFALAVGRAASPLEDASQRGRFTAIEALLHLRRNRSRYALIYAVVGTVLAVAILRGLAAFGFDVPLEVGKGVVAQMLAVLFVAAWALINDIACSNDAMRRALLGANSERAES